MTCSVVLSTCASTDEARKIAQVLLNEKLIACVNYVNVESSYWWQGKICYDKEVLLIIKTRKDLVEEVVDKIQEIHSYEVPEVIELEIRKGNEAYLKWIEQVTKE